MRCLLHRGEQHVAGNVSDQGMLFGQFDKSIRIDGAPIRIGQANEALGCHNLACPNVHLRLKVADNAVFPNRGIQLRQAKRRF